MPRKPKTTEPEAKPVEAAPEAAPVNKTAAIKAALKANAKSTPKEISEMLQAQGLDVSPGYVSTIKTNMKAKNKKAKKAAAAPASEAAGPVVPKDAVSVGLLVKAKKLVQELGGVKEARTALNALAQLMD
jgi:hypothetical protein